MAHIQKIERLRDFAIFRDFKWPSELKQFSRFNLIYGWNGTGKTVLSRLFRNLERQTPLSEGTANVIIDDTKVSSSAFSDVTAPIRVFNRDYVDENIFPVGGGELSPIFVLGKESIENQQRIDDLHLEHSQSKSQLNDAQSIKDANAESLDKLCINQAKVIRETLRSPGSNNPYYNNYDRSNFRRDAQKMSDSENPSQYRLSDDERKRLHSQHSAIAQEKLSEVSYQFPNFEELTNNTAELLSTSVTSSAIRALKDDPTLASWVQEGLTLHKDRGSKFCLFCEQTVPAERFEALNDHFSSEYERHIRQIKTQIQQLEYLSEEATNLKLPSESAIYPHLREEYSDALQSVQRELEVVQRFAEELIEQLNQKLSNPFSHLTIQIKNYSLDTDSINSLIALFKGQNQDCDQLQQRAEEARNKLANDIIAENLEEFINLRNSKEEAINNIETLRGNIRRTNEEIERLKQEISNHRIPASELNIELSRYLGHGELNLSVQETGYNITRNGQAARTLSEGEMTAVALLYFLKSLNDQNFSKDSGTVVLDDPVSSLDSTALYYAFGAIKERVRDLGQVFILTHNFLFFRQVKNWLDYEKNSAVSYYMLLTSTEQQLRCSRITDLDSLLKDYESEYHYLYSLVRKAANCTTSVDQLEHVHYLPNVIRRLLEAFLAFKVPGKTKIHGQLNQISFDDSRKNRIRRFCDTHSHNQVVDQAEQDPTILSEAPHVARDVIDLIHEVDQTHSEGMRSITVDTA